MPKARRTFQRPMGERRYRKLFVVAVEGSKTEPQYFAMFNGPSAVIKVQCLAGASNSAPAHVLKRMREHLRREGLLASDEAWLVVDKDQWTDAQLAELSAWSRESSNYGLALSNPAFELWLLLHFEAGTGVTSATDCVTRLRRHLPTYAKGVSASDFPLVRVEEAVARARAKDNPPCVDWPRGPGVTTVYRLVARMIEGEGGRGVGRCG